MANLIEPRIAHYHKEPALQVAIRDQVAEGAHRPQISLLHQILRAGLFARQRQRIAVKRIEVLKRSLTKVFSAIVRQVHFSLPLWRLSYNNTVSSRIFQHTSHLKNFGL